MSNIFDDYEVDCNTCSNYWNDTCDGVPINKKRNCNSYIATRTTDIPKQIEKLNKTVKILRESVIALCVGFILEVVLLCFTH